MRTSEAAQRCAISPDDAGPQPRRSTASSNGAGRRRARSTRPAAPGRGAGLAVEGAKTCKAEFAPVRAGGPEDNRPSTRPPGWTGTPKHGLTVARRTRERAPRCEPGPALLTPMLTAQVGLQAADDSLTHYGLTLPGVVEANPDTAGDRPAAGDVRRHGDHDRVRRLSAEPGRPAESRSARPVGRRAQMTAALCRAAPPVATRARRSQTPTRSRRQASRESRCWTECGTRHHVTAQPANFQQFKDKPRRSGGTSRYAVLPALAVGDGKYGPMRMMADCREGYYVLALAGRTPSRRPKPCRPAVCSPRPWARHATTPESRRRRRRPTST